MPSSVIRRFGYETGSRELWIEFVSGRRYVYENVPESAAASFRNAFSKGVHFNSRIRDSFRFREVAPADEGTES